MNAEEYLKSNEFLTKLVTPVPNAKQIAVLNMGYYNFAHFGMNTFTSKEWGDGKTPTSQFKLKKLDTDKWVRDLISTGSKGIIITAKHHDGFCLFNSKYTDYCIKNTPFMDGKGDIVGQLAASCKKYGFKLGIYLSPWDRHERTYGTDEYNDYFCNQLTELATNYGEIFCFWFDGACGEGTNGKKQIYDWKRYYSVIKKLQPNAATSICGEDIRWIGNESGNARHSEWSVVGRGERDCDKIAESSQKESGAFAMSDYVPPQGLEKGSRELLINEQNLIYFPSEMDISASRVGWFYRKTFEWFFARTPENLSQCYLTSVGNNATLLVNIAPNKKGELPAKFIKNMVAAKEIVSNKFKAEINTSMKKIDDFTYELSFGETEIAAVSLAEDIMKSQRIEAFDLFADGKMIFSATTVGFKKFCLFETVKCSKLTLKISSSRLEPHIKYFKVFKA